VNKDEYINQSICQAEANQCIAETEIQTFKKTYNQHRHDLYVD